MSKLTNENKVYILSDLLSTVMSDHPEFQEENTTGWDLIQSAKLWLDELNRENENHNYISWMVEGLNK